VGDWLARAGRISGPLLQAAKSKSGTEQLWYAFDSQRRRCIGIFGAERLAQAAAEKSGGRTSFGVIPEDIEIVANGSTLAEVVTDWLTMEEDEGRI